MRKHLLVAIALLGALAPRAWAYDFSAVAPSGQTLYYEINGSNVTVVPQNGGFPYYSTYPTGALTIPSSVTYNGTTYSVTSIGNYAFYNCSGLTSVTIPNSVTSIGEMAFFSCSGLTSVTIPNSVTSIGIQAFYGCSGLTSVTIPNSVTSISIAAFASCSGLTSVTIPNSVTSIGQNAFSYCIRLTSVTIPNSVTSIGERAFFSCSELTSVTIPNSVTSIGVYTFSGCSRLTSVTIPNSVTSIGQSTFLGCSGLTSVTIPNSVTSIGNEAFYNCRGLTSITIPNSVTSIGSHAFYYCSGLTSVICKGATPPTLGYNGIPTTPTITVPCGTTSAYRASWGSSYTYQEAFLFELNVASSNDTMGTAAVQQQPSCTSGTAIIAATANSGYRFDHWSNGSTDNPYTLTVTSDTTLVAYFANAGGGTDGISNIKNNNISVYTTEGRICVTIDGQTTNEFSVYDVMGRRAAHVIASDKSPVLPAGVYIVKVGTLPARKVVVVR